MMVITDPSEAPILTIDQSQVMASYTFASLTVPWLAMALPSWRYLAMISCSAIIPVLACYK